MKRLLGKKVTDPKIVEVIGSVPYTIKEGPGGKPKIVFEYMGEDIDLSAVELTALILKKMKMITEEKIHTLV